MLRISFGINTLILSLIFCPTTIPHLFLSSWWTLCLLPAPLTDLQCASFGFCLNCINVLQSKRACKGPSLGLCCSLSYICRTCRSTEHNKVFDSIMCTMRPSLSQRVTASLRIAIVLDGSSQACYFSTAYEHCPDYLSAKTNNTWSEHIHKHTPAVFFPYWPSHEPKAVK